MMQLRSEASRKMSRSRQMRLSSKEGRIGEKASLGVTLSNVCANLFTVMPLTRKRRPGSLEAETTPLQSCKARFVPPGTTAMPRR